MLAALALAFGSPTFPAVVEEELAMPCTPTCDLCHATVAGGSGTATRDFAGTVLGAGRVGADEESLRSAIATLAANGADTDGDGTTDTEALTMGLNPNADGDDFCAVPRPVYGCFQGSAWLVVGLAGLAWRRRRYTAG